jgi:hypothetical protein
LVIEPTVPAEGRDQLPIESGRTFRPERLVDYPRKSLQSFLNFLSDALPDGDVYLFGGVLRDIALFGRRGFSSDIDLVVEGNWDGCLTYLNKLGASINKFGGYRLSIAGWPIDIWKAEETWAIKQRLVAYRGIASLTETTVLNWDAILMNWRTRQVVCKPNYIEDIQQRVLGIVLEKNPDPLGMVVRVLRHLCLKDARGITSAAASFLANAVQLHSLDSIKNRELKSYGASVIEPAIYTLFKHYGTSKGLDSHERFAIASDRLKGELGLE